MNQDLLFSVPDPATEILVRVFCYKPVDSKENDSARRNVKKTRKRATQLRDWSFALAVTMMTLLALVLGSVLSGVGARYVLLAVKPYWAFGAMGMAALLVLCLVLFGRGERLRRLADDSAQLQARIVKGNLRENGYVTGNDYSFQQLLAHAPVRRDRGTQKGVNVIQDFPEEAARFFGDPRVVGSDSRIRNRHHQNLYEQLADMLQLTSAGTIMEAARHHFGEHINYARWNEDLYQKEYVRAHTVLGQVLHIRP